MCHVRHDPVMVAGEPGIVPPIAHSVLCLQMPSLTVSKTLGAHTRIQVSGACALVFWTSEPDRALGAGRKDCDIWYTVANLFQWGPNNRISCSKLSACTIERNQTSNTLHQWVGLQFNKEEHQRLSSQDLILFFQAICRVWLSGLKLLDSMNWYNFPSLDWSLSADQDIGSFEWKC